jgi:putative flippase GtrA
LKGPFVLPKQFFSFALIGVANTLIHGAFLAWFIEWWKWPIPAAHAVAFGVANLFSYAVNSRWTFKTALSWVGYSRFFLSSLLSLALTLLISWLAQLQGLDYKEGFVLVVLLVPAFSFLVMKFWAFRSID